MKTLPKTLLAAVLAVMLLFSSVVSVSADDINDFVDVHDGEVTVGGNPSQELTESKKIDGDLTVSNMDNALTVVSYNGDSTFTVTGAVTDKVSSESHDNVGAEAVKVSSGTHNSTVTVGEAAAEVVNTSTSGGSVEAIAVEAGACVYIENQEALTSVTVNGDAAAAAKTAGSGSKAAAYAVEAKAWSDGVVSIQIAGDAEAAATGDETAYAYAVRAQSEASNWALPEDPPPPLLPASVEVTVEGKAVAAAAVTGENADPDAAVAFAVEADAEYEGAETSVTVGKGAEGMVMAEAKDGGKTTVEILDGGVIARNANIQGDEQAEGAVTVRNNNGIVDVSIAGGVDSADSNFAVLAGAEGLCAETTLTMTDGDISEKDAQYAAAAALFVSDGGTLNATVTGEAIQAEVTGKSTSGRTQAVGLELTNSGGVLNVEAEADIVATGADESIGVEVTSEQATYTTVEKVGTSALDHYLTDDEKATAFTVYMDGSPVTAYRIRVSGGDQMIYRDDDGNLYEIKSDGGSYTKTAEGTTNLTLTGDVTADQVGLDLDIADPQTANILVDGTVRGGDAGIVLSEQTEIGDNLTLTVWEVVPNKDGAVILTKTTDESGKSVYTENKEAEKLLQYIIKIADNSKDYITTSGTKDQVAGNGETYQVAHENDTVTLKLNIPADKELVGVYGDKDQKYELTRDADGNYYITVPRGGGVLLSLTLKDVPKPDPPKPDPKPQPKTDTGSGDSTLLLTIVDTTGTVTISFFSNGEFKAEYPENRTETGKFKLDNGQIVLVNSKGHEMPMTQDSGAWKLIYTGGEDPTPYEFLVEDKDVQLLVKNREDHQK